MEVLSRVEQSRITDRRGANGSVWLLTGASAIIVISFCAPFLWMLNQWFVIEEYSPGPAVPILAFIALWHALKKKQALPRIPRRAARWGLVTVACLAVLIYVGKEHTRLLPGSPFLSAASYLILFAGMSFALLWSGFLVSRAARPESGRGAEGLGLALIVLSLAVHFLAVRGDLPRASIVSYIVLLYAISWYLHGWRTVKGLTFPYALLLLMVPVGFIDEIAGVPLRLMATNAAVFLMRMVGFKVVQTGNWFAVGSMEFTVDAPCSGLRSLMALTALGATFAYVTQPTLLKKVLLTACAIPIALMTNIVRLACVGIFAQLVGRSFAVSVFHDHAAVFLYILAIVILMSLDRKVFQAEWFRVKNF